MRALRWGAGAPLAAPSRRCGQGADTGASAPASIRSATYADQTSVSMEMSSVSYDLSCVCHRAGVSLKLVFARSRPAMMERPAARSHRHMCGALSVLPVADCSTATSASLRRDRST